MNTSANQPHAWREFNHDTRLVLHTLKAHLQRAGVDATQDQSKALQGAGQCADSLLQLLENFAASAGSSVVGPATSSPQSGDSLFGGTAPEAANLVLPRIPSAELAQFEQMMLAGLLLSIEQWASALAQAHPEWAEVGDALGFYAYSADVRSLQLVLDRWLADAR